MIRHPSCAIRRRVCGLLLNPTCPDSSGIHALGRRRRPSGGLERGAPVGAASRSDAMPCHGARLSAVGAGNLREPVGCVGLSEPNAGLGGPVPRPDMRHRAGSRRGEFTETRGCLICGAGNAGLAETNVGIFEAWRLYGESWKRVGTWTVWGSEAHEDLRDMGCSVWPARWGLRTWSFLTQIWGRRLGVGGGHPNAWRTKGHGRLDVICGLGKKAKETLDPTELWGA